MTGNEKTWQRKVSNIKRKKTVASLFKFEKTKFKKKEFQKETYQYSFFDNQDI